MQAPPVQYAAYPREQVPPGTADKLQSLADGYFSINWVFLVHVLGVIVVFGGMMVIGGDTAGLVYFLVGLLALAVGIGYLSFHRAKKIAYGADWGSSAPLMTAILMGANAIFGGIIGYVVLQSIAGSAMKTKYGVKTGFFGINKKVVDARVAELRSLEAGGPAASVV